MPALSHAQLRKIGLVSSLVVGGFLVAHSINAFVAEALFLAPDRPPVAGDREIPAARTVPANQLAEDVRASGLFVVPAVPLGQTASFGGGGSGGGSIGGGGGRQGGAAGHAVRASIGTAEKIRVIGIVFGDQRGVFAIVEELTGKRQSLYRLHEEIPDLGEVSEIRRNGMIVRRGNLEELLELAADEKPVTTASGQGAVPASGKPLHRVVDRREVEQAMSDLPKLLTQARAVPNMVNGTLSGFRIDYVAPASFYEKIGIQSGDVLQRVNGVDIRDPSTMFSLLQQLKNERTVKLDMVRNNQRSTMTYELR